MRNIELGEDGFGKSRKPTFSGLIIADKVSRRRMIAISVADKVSTRHRIESNKMSRKVR